jgi:hypothetical protein
MVTGTLGEGYEDGYKLYNMNSRWRWCIRLSHATTGMTLLRWQ